jgi:uncharacterized membrane protein
LKRPEKDSSAEMTESPLVASPGIYLFLRIIYAACLFGEEKLVKRWNAVKTQK